MYLKIINYVNDCIENKTDFTMRINNQGDICIPSDGFVVSITPLINIGMNIEQIIKFVLSKKTIKIEGKDYNLFIGGWFENNKDMLKYDISVVIENRDEAIEIGKYCCQIAIYDLVNNKTILL